MQFGRQEISWNLYCLKCFKNIILKTMLHSSILQRKTSKEWIISHLALILKYPVTLHSVAVWAACLLHACFNRVTQFFQLGGSPISSPAVLAPCKLYSKSVQACCPNIVLDIYTLLYFIYNVWWTLNTVSTLYVSLMT